MCVTLPSSLRMVTSRQPESRSYPYPRCLYRQSRSRSRPTHAGPTQNWPPASTIGLSVVLRESASAGNAVTLAATSRIEASVFIRSSFDQGTEGKLLSRASGSALWSSHEPPLTSAFGRLHDETGSSSAPQRMYDIAV